MMNVEENGLTLVTDLWFGDYEWAAIEIYYSAEKKRYFWIAGSGCSCNGLWDEVNSLADFCEGTLTNAASALRRFAADEYMHDPRTDKGNFVYAMGQLMQHRP